jgi:RNA polymerase sigma-70 factor, ECF subfamily
MEYTGEFIRKLIQRNPDAFAKLYKETVQMIYNYILYRVSGNISAAEEIQSEVYCDAINHVASLSLTHNVKAWIYRIARSKIANHFRALQRERKWQVNNTPEDLNLDSGPDTPEFKLLIKEHKLLIHSAFSHLDETQREVLKLKYIEDHSVKEIAEKTGKTLKSVESLLYRARNEFAREIRILSREPVYEKRKA